MNEETDFGPADWDARLANALQDNNELQAAIFDIIR